MKRAAALLLSAAFVILSPGLAPYEAAAQMLEAPASAPSLPVSLELPAAPEQAPGIPDAAASLDDARSLEAPLGSSLSSLEIPAERELGSRTLELRTAERAAAGAAPELSCIFDRQGLAAAPAPGAAPSPDVFSALTKEQKAWFESNYAEHLQLKDGEADVQAQKFSVREKFYQNLVARPVTMSNTGVDEKAFYRNEAKRKPEKGLNEATLWALIMAKANRSEREGVERRLARVDFSKRSPRDPLSFIEIEESYHTRVLKDALKIVGLDMKELPPQKLTSWLVRFMAALPMSVSNILIMSSEVAGVALFRRLRDHARVMFKDQPEEARARVEALFQQILIDEVGHVHFVRSRLGPVRLWIAKKMLPLLARYFMIDIPEAGMLFGKKELLRTIVAADIEGASAEYANKLDPYKPTELPPAPPAKDPFSPMTRAQKDWFLKRYVEHLRRRDGEPDLKTLTFSVREKAYRDMEARPVVWEGAPPVDPADFARNEAVVVPESALTAKTLRAQRTLWALMVAKANRAEAYAVKQVLRHSDLSKRPSDDPMRWIDVEEFYHTRTLQDMLKVLRLDMKELPPPPAIRVLALILSYLPRSISTIFLLPSEVIGVESFRVMREKAHELFADQPPALARIDELFQQIMIDEVGHVYYARSQLGPVRLWIAKKLVPIILRAMMRRGTEDDLLFGREKRIRDAATADIDAAAAPFPDRFQPW